MSIWKRKKKYKNVASYTHIRSVLDNIRRVFFPCLFSYQYCKLISFIFKYCFMFTLQSRGPKLKLNSGLCRYWHLVRAGLQPLSTAIKCSVSQSTNVFSTNMFDSHWPSGQTACWGKLIFFFFILLKKNVTKISQKQLAQVAEPKMLNLRYIHIVYIGLQFVHLCRPDEGDVNQSISYLTT